MEKNEVMKDIFKILNEQSDPFFRFNEPLIYQNPIIVWNKLKLKSTPNSRSIYFKLDNTINSGNNSEVIVDLIDLNINGLVLYDNDGNKIEILNPGYYEMFLSSNSTFLILLNKNGLSKSELLNYDILGETISEIYDAIENIEVGEFTGIADDSISLNKLSPVVRNKINEVDNLSEILSEGISRDDLNFYVKSGTFNHFNPNSNEIDENGWYNYQNGNYVLNNFDPNQPALQNYGNTGNIVISPNKSYYTNMGPYVSYFNSNGVFISGELIGVNGGSFTTVSNTKYVNISVWKPNIQTSYIVEGTSPVSSFSEHYSDNAVLHLPKLVNPNLYGKKWLAVGDSLTTNDYTTKTYQEYICEKNLMIKKTNAISGSTITLRNGHSNSILERLQTLDVDADIITILAGGNDYGQNVPLGTMSDLGFNTYYGALHNLCSGLITKYPLKRIGFITTLQSKDPDRIKLAQYVNAMKEVCAFYSIPVLDLTYASGLYPTNANINNTFYTNADGLHPNAVGHEFISRKIEQFLITL